MFLPLYLCNQRRRQLWESVWVGGGGRAEGGLGNDVTVNGVIERFQRERDAG